MAPTTEDLLNYFRRKVQDLIEEAESADIVIRIETEPLEPLAMGNHKMVASVEPKHPY